jgi:hypothetical protein
VGGVEAGSCGWVILGGGFHFFCVAKIYVLEVVLCECGYVGAGGGAGYGAACPCGVWVAR